MRNGSKKWPAPAKRIYRTLPVMSKFSFKIERFAVVGCEPNTEVGIYKRKHALDQESDEENN